MKQDRMSRENLIIYGFGLFPVIWIALLTAPYIRGGLAGIVMGLGKAMENPFSISICEDSVKAVLIFIGIYVLILGIYVSSARNYRRREEHGSAKWGRAESLFKKYADKNKSNNIVLTQNTAIGLDGRKHRRNLNVLVVGGSGSGKTRYFAKPNVMQANTSFVILDPKGDV